MALNTDLHISLTRHFIDENPSSIVVYRPTYVDDGVGGRVMTGETQLPPQIMRHVGIEPRRGHTLLMLVTRDGETVVANSSVIAMPEADLQNQDQFTINGGTGRYEVVHVESHPEWRIRAEVYLHRG